MSKPKGFWAKSSYVFSRASVAYKRSLELAADIGGWWDNYYLCSDSGATSEDKDSEKSLLPSSCCIAPHYWSFNSAVETCLSIQYPGGLHCYNIIKIDANVSISFSSSYFLYWAVSKEVEWHSWTTACLQINYRTLNLEKTTSANSTHCGAQQSLRAEVK